MSTLTTWSELRASWQSHNLNQQIRNLCQSNGIPIDYDKKTDQFDNWGNWQWHIRNRLTSRQLGVFLRLFPQFQKQKSLLDEYLKSYDLSLLPLNLMLPKAVQKFLPRLGLKPAPDPYGVQRSDSVIIRQEQDKTYYLATRKPKYATFLQILGSGAGRVFCPIGCAGCYRGPQTRFNRPLTVIHLDGRQQTVWIPQPEKQTKLLVEDWNTRPEYTGVYDILFSGGEPMMLPNATWFEILKQLEKAKHLRSFRICTATLFLGLPFRFDDEFIGLLTDFRTRTGVQVKFSVHVSHPEFITPEAIYYAMKFRHADIELLPQCPLEPGVNFWVDDLLKTTQTLSRLDRLLSLVIGTRPYKWILDMQGGISLLSAIEAYRMVHDRHQLESDISRPTSFALFLPIPEGNINLSYHSL